MPEIGQGIERRVAAALHPLDRPEEVPGRRPRCPELPADLLKGVTEGRRSGGFDGTRAQGDPHRRGDADGRGAPDREVPDRRDDLTVVGAGDVPLDEREGPLVDHHDGAVLPEDGADCLVQCHR